MDTQMIESKFARMSARAKVHGPHLRWLERMVGAVRIDIGRDRKGEFFDVTVNTSDRVDVNVIDVRPRDRHLLLMVDGNDGRQKFLCGHDERSWFVAAVPERAHASNVVTAMEALKPAQVRAAQERAGLKGPESRRRKNRAFVRQGEWFFLPRPGMRVDPKLVLHHEPVRRGGGKPHVLEMAYRAGGELVYVSALFPNGLTHLEREQWFASTQRAKRPVLDWRPMMRNPQLYAKGTVRHSDHKTITLHDWHLVQMNTETQAQAMRHVAFLD